YSWARAGRWGLREASRPALDRLTTARQEGRWNSPPVSTVILVANSSGASGAVDFAFPTGPSLPKVRPNDPRREFATSINSPVTKGHLKEPSAGTVVRSGISVSLSRNSSQKSGVLR